ncbi:hypothetical protein FLAVO9AF_10021 [Flavobacterium sp. 9AF]|uniref:hypothetical protein n=1 Tax=Flavobacterium sp. 9AF TaxID=2653142 RepID=UPI0012F24008|nr:hypothetical protein [Flavobacterium sp. 9AF]VXA91796.1 hypothetical protein FLAVO9AF_10021 [Flavobacterium sp. 9AF]
MSTLEEITNSSLLATYEICELFGYTKQAFYKRKSNATLIKYNPDVIRSLVLNIRKQLPRTGGKKLYIMLQEDFVKHNICIGRDVFLDFLKTEYLQVTKVRRYYNTTNSTHWMKPYPNLIKNISLNKPEQVWVADITYLRKNVLFTSINRCLFQENCRLSIS